jgi:hypothetical protein
MRLGAPWGLQVDEHGHVPLPRERWVSDPTPLQSLCNIDNIDNTMGINGAESFIQSEGFEGACAPLPLACNLMHNPASISTQKNEADQGLLPKESTRMGAHESASLLQVHIFPVQLSRTAEPT